MSSTNPREVTMIKSIVIAVVTSLIVWAVSFHFLFSYYRLVPSLIIALAVGLIAILLLRGFLSKPGLAEPSLGLQLIVTGIVVFGGLAIASQFLRSGACGMLAKPVIYCNKPNVIPDEICIDKHGAIEWDTSQVPAGTTVKLDNFMKLDIWGNKPEKPVKCDDSDKCEGYKDKPIKAKVKYQAEGTFKYSLTCTDSNGNAEVKDPMIEVPK